jgi:hypothetical protein
MAILLLGVFAVILMHSLGASFTAFPRKFLELFLKKD